MRRHVFHVLQQFPGVNTSKAITIMCVVRINVYSENRQEERRGKCLKELLSSSEIEMSEHVFISNEREGAEKRKRRIRLCFCEKAGRRVNSKEKHQTTTNIALALFKNTPKSKVFARKCWLRLRVNILILSDWITEIRDWDFSQVCNEIFGKRFAKSQIYRSFLSTSSVALDQCSPNGVSRNNCVRKF